MNELIIEIENADIPDYLKREYINNIYAYGTFYAPAEDNEDDEYES